MASPHLSVVAKLAASCYDGNAEYPSAPGERAQLHHEFKLLNTYGPGVTPVLPGFLEHRGN